MTALLALAAGLALWPRTPGRTSRLAAAGRPPPDPAASGPLPAWRRAAVAGLGGAAVLVLLGGGWPAGAAAVGTAVLVERRLRTADGSAAAVRADLVRELPVACDLLAVCLAAGTPVGSAVGAVAPAVDGPLGGELTRVAGLYRLGAGPRRAWSGTAPEIAVLARTVVRAGESGSGIVPALHRMAADARAAQRSALEASVRRAGVWVLAPLGACFLPAFVCLGVAPLVLGIAADVFG